MIEQSYQLVKAPQDDSYCLLKQLSICMSAMGQKHLYPCFGVEIAQYHYWSIVCLMSLDLTTILYRLMGSPLGGLLGMIFRKEVFAQAYYYK
jgi:hypothetical protein